MEEREYKAEEREDEIPDQRIRRKQSIVPVIIFTVLLLIVVNLPFIIYAVAHFFHREDVTDCCFDVSGAERFDSLKYQHIMVDDSTKDALKDLLSGRDIELEENAAQRSVFSLKMTDRKYH